MTRPVLAAVLAACVSLSGAATVLAPEPAVAQSMLDGDWRGQASGNVVRIRESVDGIHVAAVTNNPGQSAPMLFQRTAPGEFRFTFPDGSQAIVTLEASGGMRIRNPNGWTDLFVRTQP